MRSFVRALAAAAIAALAHAALAQDSLRLIEQDIKAGLIYNFLLYTQWPPAARADHPVVVCVYGNDPFNGRLDLMARRTVNQRAIQVRRVRADRELDSCSMVFVNAEERGDWPRLRAYLATKSTLTVSDYDGFARAGGMLELTRVNDRIGVRVNLGAAEAARLSIQNRLVRLASIVRTDQP